MSTCCSPTKPRSSRCTRCRLSTDALQQVRADCRIGALTRSGAGSVIVSGDEVHVVEAVKVARVVDTRRAPATSMRQVFLYGQATGRSLVESARLGSLAASEIIAQVGARPRAEPCKTRARVRASLEFSQPDGMDDVIRSLAQNQVGTLARR